MSRFSNRPTKIGLALSARDAIPPGYAAVGEALPVAAAVASAVVFPMRACKEDEAGACTTNYTSPKK